MLLLLACFLLQTTGNTEDIKVDFVERVTVIRLPVKVTLDGKPFRKLNRQNLQIMENGEVVALDRLEEVQSSLIIHLLFDLSTSNDRNIITAKRAGKEIIEAMRPGDKVKLSFFSSTYQSLSDYTDDKNKLLTRLSFLSPVGSTALYDGISMGLEDLSRQKGNRFLVVFSDGHDLLSITTEGELMNQARNLQIPILFGAFKAQRKSANLLEAQYNYMKSLAHESGGTTLEEGLEKGLEQFLDLNRKRWMVSFTPSDPSNLEQWRSLVVTISDCPDCQLEYKKAYQISGLQ